MAEEEVVAVAAVAVEIEVVVLERYNFAPSRALLATSADSWDIMPTSARTGPPEHLEDLVVDHRDLEVQLEDLERLVVAPMLDSQEIKSSMVVVAVPVVVTRTTTNRTLTNKITTNRTITTTNNRIITNNNNNNHRTTINKTITNRITTNPTNNTTRTEEALGKHNAEASTSAVLVEISFSRHPLQHQSKSGMLRGICLPLVSFSL